MELGGGLRFGDRLLPPIRTALLSILRCASNCYLDM
jgi:hypothetical protein